LLPILIKLKLATTAVAGWTVAATPAPVPFGAFAVALAADAGAPVGVALYDENDHQQGTVAIWRDGWTDDDTSAELKRLFRCRTTHREKLLAQKTLAMLADISERYGKTIEYVSVYRVGGGESDTSPHRAGRAIDFRIRGVALREVRDYVWRAYSDVGVGWYPSEQFLHIDSRPGLHDTAWTFVNGDNRYHPYWAELARAPQVPTRDHGPKS
jgi:uncharacterized protein YcbK (DUF882 family)